MWINQIEPCFLGKNVLASQFLLFVTRTFLLEKLCSKSAHLYISPWNLNPDLGTDQYESDSYLWFESIFVKLQIVDLIEDLLEKSDYCHEFWWNQPVWSLISGYSGLWNWEFQVSQSECSVILAPNPSTVTVCKTSNPFFGVWQ